MEPCPSDPFADPGRPVTAPVPPSTVVRRRSLCSPAGRSVAAAPALSHVHECRPRPAAAPDPESWGAEQPARVPQDAAIEAPASALDGARGGRARVPRRTAAAGARPPWVLRGAGWGHSLGMSQYGAMEMAKDG